MANVEICMLIEIKYTALFTSDGSNAFSRSTAPVLHRTQSEHVYDVARRR